MQEYGGIIIFFAIVGGLSVAALWVSGSQTSLTQHPAVETGPSASATTARAAPSAAATENVVPPSGPYPSTGPVGTPGTSPPVRPSPEPMNNGRPIHR